MLGIASWYGPGFNGHRTSSGAIYNQDDLTAASVMFPLGAIVRVTNLANGRGGGRDDQRSRPLSARAGD